jgi:hypothetical protein
MMIFNYLRDHLSISDLTSDLSRDFIFFDPCLVSSQEDIEQFTILQRISKTTLILNKKRIISFRFNIDKILFIDIVNLNISVDVITFHIVLVQTLFLLCWIDMNRLRLYFNNLINMFIEERSINKVLFRKNFYVIHSNQIKKFQIQIFMSSKSLIKNETRFSNFIQIWKHFSWQMIFKSV